jgi:cell division protein FtsW (lipid II flippase)
MMANATLPAIGIPIPFISSGGSSLIALWLMLGVSQSALVGFREEAEVTHANRPHRWWHWRSRFSRA